MIYAKLHSWKQNHQELLKNVTYKVNEEHLRAKQLANPLICKTFTITKMLTSSKVNVETKYLATQDLSA